MKSQELKEQFIQLRAEGLSFSKIAEQLHISKTTCTSWDKELTAQIADEKKRRLRELSEQYGIAKEARITTLGETLKRIDEAIEQADFTTIKDPTKLLEYRLRYMDALKAEYSGIAANEPVEKMNAETILTALSGLLQRLQAGEITPEQARQESIIFSQLLKADETVEIKNKLAELEAILGR